MKKLLASLALLISVSTVSASTITCTDITTNLVRYKENQPTVQVLLLQNFLVAKGLLKVTPTGFFGSATYNAVKLYQKNTGISVTGNIGIATRAAIKKESCTSTIPTTPPVTTPIPVTPPSTGGGSTGGGSPTPIAISGTCGISNTTPVSTAPTTGLCSSGTASPVSGSGPWTWACTGSNGGTTAGCSANLTPVVTYTLTTSAANGTINKSPSGTTFTAGTVVTLTAVPALGFIFKAWTGDCVGTVSTCTLSMTGAKSVTATFTVVPSTMPAPTPTPEPTVPPVTGWTKISNEWDSFTLQISQTVRFGEGSNWVQKQGVTTGMCTSAFFGSDPSVGIVKTCQVATGTTLPVPLPAPVPTPVPSPTPAATTTTYMPFIDSSKIPTGTLGINYDYVEDRGVFPPLSTSGDFRTVCNYSHMNFDDPIVYPGQPGKSHLHVFFGNTGVNANTTAASIASTGNSTCRGGTINRSSYWAPAMIDMRDGSPVKPEVAIIYYKAGAILPSSTITAFPAGLRMIAGDPKNVTPYVNSWDGTGGFTCINPTTGMGPSLTSAIPDCPVGSIIWQRVIFPQCWDGVNLDSANHKSHMAYPINANGGYCPADHPVAIPEITINVRYPVTELHQSTHWQLSSDMYDSTLPRGYSLHSDWFNGWKPDIVNTWVNLCDKAYKDCSAHMLGDGRQMMEFEGN